jgi:hypothetical protein
MGGTSIFNWYTIKNVNEFTSKFFVNGVSSRINDLAVSGLVEVLYIFMTKNRIFVRGL